MKEHAHHPVVEEVSMICRNHYHYIENFIENQNVLPFLKDDKDITIIIDS